MFGLADLVSLIISAFIILPVVVFLRELGYLIFSGLFGVVQPRITIGTGPRLIKFGMLDIRKYYHFYSWFSYDDLKYKNKFAYVCIYSAPILMNLSVAFLLNFLIANGWAQEYKTFWDRFIFYAFYYALFDIVPMFTLNGKPNNGMIIYQMIRYGRRVDYNTDPFLPSTSEVETQYLEHMKKIEEIKKEREKENSK
ncbi:hypothetical protein D1B33_11020 [Lysinibacillus yapensis]|uniref:Uncharacterized protein n=1 Tax=Ureibacillus yapensis TaxID=2304605 RepID=A0A396S676_9BACL|nr:hypothetical protein [Lysinibacillus yapensis]RHW36165.1 hypothetical protein D1B33_11020 [Lysinibacillus yapensis]